MVKIEVNVLLYDAQAGTVDHSKADDDDDDGIEGGAGPSSRSNVGPSMTNLRDTTNNYMMGPTIEELDDSDDEDVLADLGEIPGKAQRPAGPPPMSAGMHAMAMHDCIHVRDCMQYPHHRYAHSIPSPLSRTCP